MAQAEANARAVGGSFEVLEDFDAGFRGADVVYPKSWGCMLETDDQAASAEIGAKRYTDWIATSAGWRWQPDDAIYMHCLPADRGIEVADAVIDGPQQRGVRRGGESAARAEGRHGPDHVRGSA